jgi:hypothetical protein
MFKFLFYFYLGFIILDSVNAYSEPDTSLLHKSINLSINYIFDGGFRTLDSLKYPSNPDLEAGEFFLEININREGQVKHVDYNSKKSEKASKLLIKNLVSSTYALKFSSSKISPLKQYGEIKYKYDLTIQDTIKYNDSTFMVRRFRNDNSIISITRYKSFRPDLRHGESVSFHPNGIKECVGQFNNDTPFGKWIITNADGSLSKELDYNNAYYSFSKLKNDTVFQIADVAAMFKGTSFIDYIVNNFNYPKFSKQKVMDARVIITFYIDEFGKVYSTRLMNRGSSNDINIELLRLVINSPDWKPAILNQKAVKQKLSVSVSFYEDKKIIENLSNISVDYPTENDSQTIYLLAPVPAKFPSENFSSNYVPAKFPSENFLSYYVNELIKQKPSFKGKIIVQFLVDRYGKMKNVNIQKSPELNDNDRDLIIRTLLNCPDWEPARNKNISVNQLFSFPIYLD